jgi:hypothetical protein
MWDEMGVGGVVVAGRDGEWGGRGGSRVWEWEGMKGAGHVRLRSRKSPAVH